MPNPNFMPFFNQFKKLSKHAGMDIEPKLTDWFEFAKRASYSQLSGQIGSLLRTIGKGGATFSENPSLSNTIAETLEMIDNHEPSIAKELLKIKNLDASEALKQKALAELLYSQSVVQFLTSGLLNYLHNMEAENRASNKPEPSEKDQRIQEIAKDAMDDLQKDINAIVDRGAYDNWGLFFKHLFKGLFKMLDIITLEMGGYVPQKDKDASKSSKPAYLI